MRRATVVAAAGLLGVAGCQPREETPEEMQARMEQESQAAQQAIEAAAASFAQHFNAGHADSVATFYTEQAHLMPPNEPAVHGRTAVRDMMALWFGMGQWTLDLQVGSVMANGPLAVESGTYTMTFTPGPDAPMPAMSDTGKYLVHWHKVGDRWMIAEDIWNSDMAMTMPEPAPRR